MSQTARVPRPPVDDTDITVRNRRMLTVGGVMVLLAAVVAGGYWYTHQAGKAAPPPTALSITQVGGDLVVGSANAVHHAVITESFTCASCAAFEQAAQTFLHADAAQGIVQIRYVIPPGSNTGYDAALQADPTRALTIHDELFSTGKPSGSGSSGVLTVTLDGKQLSTANPLDTANTLETALAR